MILLSLDFETEGLSAEEHSITEVGAVIWSTVQNRALETASYLVKTGRPLSQEVTDLTGITTAALEHFGYEQAEGFQKLQDMIEVCDAFVGQNVVRFDKKFYEKWAEKNNAKPIEKLWIDSRTDLPNVESKHLGYMAADAGFLNPFPHNAVSDCLTVLRLVSMHDIDKVVERAKSPLVILKAHVNFDSNALAKKRKYGWNAERKFWWKVVKQMDMQKEISEAPFDISVVTDIPVEKLWYS